MVVFLSIVSTICVLTIICCIVSTIYVLLVRYIVRYIGNRLNLNAKTITISNTIVCSCICIYIVIKYSKLLFIFFL